MIPTFQRCSLILISCAAPQVYIPPYLNQGFQQPTFTLPKNDWAYGSTNTITNIKLFKGTLSTLKISLLAGT